MENGIVTVFASMAAVMTFITIIIGLGKKYHDEDRKRKNDSLSKC